MPDYQQSRLWDEPESPAPAPARRREAVRRAQPTDTPARLPLWPTDQPAAPEPPPAPPRPKRPIRSPATETLSAVRSPAPPETPPPPTVAPPQTILAAPPPAVAPSPPPPSARTPSSPRSPVVAPAPPPHPTLSSRSAPVRAAPKTTSPRPVRAPQPARQTAGDDAMEAAADAVEGLLEEVGPRAPALRPFVRAFPPQPRWGEPWLAGRPDGVDPPPFAPGAASYASALREVVAGRRRLRLDGWWADGRPGAIIAVVRSSIGQDTPEWEIAQTIGLDD